MISLNFVKKTRTCIFGYGHKKFCYKINLKEAFLRNKRYFLTIKKKFKRYKTLNKKEKVIF